MKRKVTAGTTGFSLPIKVFSTASTTGGGLTGLTNATSGLVAEYRRQGQATWTNISLVGAPTKTIGTWVDGGFLADGNRGAYELDLPNLVLAAGARFVLVRLYGAANMLDVDVEIELDVVNYQTAAFGAALATHWTSTRAGYLDSVLIAANSNRTVQVTGSNHVAASIHSAEPDSIPAGALTDAAIVEVQSGLALQSTLFLVAGYTDTEIAAIKVVTDKLNTGLVADGAVFQFTANMLELGPAGGGGGSGDATVANQQLILDQLDVIQAKTDLIGTSQALLAGAVLAPGTITSFPEILTIGDSYTVANGRAIQIPIIDSNGNPISEAGTLLFADADVSFIIKRASDTEASRILTCNASFVDPPGTGTGEGPYALIEIPAEETAKGLMKYQYSGILKFTWPGTADEVISFETGTITFDN